jgi:hypothetical protein
MDLEKILFIAPLLNMEIYSYLDAEVLRTMNMLKVSQYMIKILMLLIHLKLKIM